MNSNKSINIIFMPISIYEGMAGSQRLNNYLPYLKEINISYTNISYANTKNRKIINDDEIVYYYYSRIKLFLIQFPIIFRLVRLKKKGMKNVIYNYGYINANNCFCLILAKLIGYKIVIDIVEDNSVNDSHLPFLTKLLHKSSVIFLKYIRYIVDGIVVISKHLEEYVLITSKGKIPIIKIPITININEYKSQKYLDPNVRIFYGGSFSPKDGLVFLLKAFDIVMKRGYGCKLIITGKGLKKDMSIFFQELSKLKNKEHVEYKGYLSRAQYISTLCSCSINCMTRINSKFANAGFPFKLGEMLATGNPVIVTDVGDIKEYLTNNVNSLIIRPENENELSNAIDFIINNPHNAINIGKNGKQKAITAFDAKKHSVRLVDFLRQI